MTYTLGSGIRTIKNSDISYPFHIRVIGIDPQTLEETIAKCQKILTEFKNVGIKHNIYYPGDDGSGECIDSIYAVIEKNDNIEIVLIAERWGVEDKFIVPLNPHPELVELGGAEYKNKEDFIAAILDKMPTAKILKQGSGDLKFIVIRHRE